MEKKSFAMPKAIILGTGPGSINVAHYCLCCSIRPVILEPSGSIAADPGLQRLVHSATDCSELSVTAELYTHQLVRAVFFVRDEICSLHAIHRLTGEMTLYSADYFYFPVPLHRFKTAMSHVPDYQFLPDRKFANLLSDPHPILKEMTS
jgi:hypothetical protein